MARPPQFSGTLAKLWYQHPGLQGKPVRIRYCAATVSDHRKSEYLNASATTLEQGAFMFISSAVPFHHHSFYRTIALASVFVSLWGCGLHKRSNASPDGATNIQLDKAQVAEGLLFTAIDREFGASALYFLDFKDQSIRTLRSGESGDPVVFPLRDNRIALINRTSGSQNFRSLSFDKTSRQWTTDGPQIALPGNGVGDPHSIFEGDNGQIWMAQNSAGQISLWNQKDGQTIKTLSPASTDGPVNENDATAKASAMARPEILRRASLNGKDGMIVINQGLDRAYKANGRQSVSFFDLDGSAIDLVTQTEGLQSLPLVGANPIGAFHQTDTAIQILSLCTAYLGDGCKPTVETLSLAEGEISTAYDLSREIIWLNGGSASGPSGTILASTHRSNTADSGYEISQIDPGTQSIRTFLPLTSSYGWGLLVYDLATETLYLGEMIGSGTGRLSVITKDGKSTPIDLPFIPYQGVLVH